MGRAFLGAAAGSMFQGEGSAGASTQHFERTLEPGWALKRGAAVEAISWNVCVPGQGNWMFSQSHVAGGGGAGEMIRFAL